MKKLTPSYKKWLLNRSRTQLKRTSCRTNPRHSKQLRNIVTAWFGDHVEKLVCTGERTVPPAIICLDENSKDTLRFLAHLRERFRAAKLKSPGKPLAWVAPPRPGKLGRISGYADYSVIRDISTAAALVMAAEYDRAHLLIGSVPPTINIHEWGGDIFNKLFELGFFEIVGLLSPSVREHYREVGDIRTMRILKGINASDLQTASEMLIQTSRFIDEQGAMSDDILFALNSALAEAMANVARHAYPQDLEFEYAHVNAWWVTASADRRTRRLTVVIYDQGASIPVTLPRNRDFAHLLQWLSGLVAQRAFEYQYDADYIKGALQRGRTQTGERGRGEGLPQMKELVDICGAGSLTIWSRGGVCRYEPKKDLLMHNHDCSIGGTLIEWVMDLPQVK